MLCCARKPSEQPHVLRLIETSRRPVGLNWCFAGPGSKQIPKAASQKSVSHARGTKIGSGLLNGRMNHKRRKLIHQTPAEPVRSIDPPIVPSKQ